MLCELLRNYLIMHRLQKRTALLPSQTPRLQAKPEVESARQFCTFLRHVEKRLTLAQRGAYSRSSLSGAAQKSRSSRQ